MFANPKHPRSDGLPFWAEGRVSLFAFEALKLCKAPYGYAGKPATMRKLAAKGLVHQIESGAYVVTDEGIDLIEGRCRCPPEFDMRGELPYSPADYGRLAFTSTARRTVHSRQPPQGVSEMEQAAPAKPLSYTIEPVPGRCDVIRPRFGIRASSRARP